jgi:hypothetical protein
MAMLLEDLAEETSAGNQRLADRLDAEAHHLRQLEREVEELEKRHIDPERQVEDQRQRLARLEGIRQRGVESARQATDYILSRMPACEVVWQGALARLHQDPNREDAETLLQTVLDGFASGHQLVRSVRGLWTVPQKLGATPERLDELDRAEAWFEERAEEAKRALEHRSRGWQPSEPDRFALGLRLGREGRTVPAAEARARFRRHQGEEVPGEVPR